MYCRKCGNELKEDDMFCNKCGTKVELINNSDELQNNDMKDKEQNAEECFIRKIKWGQVLYYLIGCDIVAIIISMLAGFETINYLVIIFTIFVFFGGLINSAYIIGICPSCNRKIEILGKDVQKSGENTIFDCPLCNKKIVIK